MKPRKIVLLFTFLSVSPLAMSNGFGLDATRVIYPQSEGGTAVTVRNNTPDTAYLVRSVVSTDVDGKHLSPAFLVSPPLVRLEPGSRNALRIRLLQPAGLPAHQESLFYFQTTGIPGSKNPLARHSTSGFPSVGGQISFGVGNTVKLFYRPEGLPAPDRETYQKLVFERVPGALKVINPTPYYVTLSRLRVDGRPVRFSPHQPGLLAPSASQVYGTGSSQRKRVSWGIIDDFGGTQEFEVAVH
ncbi:fimbrial biogenesis chaperone [Enterobacter cloacae]|uniref:fimbrial biogenesis chaperone n=1 Tax=Enterobacter cloacae TaxID=550 RepID=UPI002B1ECDF2|nr:molecular chaperone [Enterobacter cloacae]MEA5217583.1 molecular chaperone [Enterobacter cloacae]